MGLWVLIKGTRYEFLKRENCEEAQGFLYAKPLPAEEFETYLRTHRLAAAADADPHSGDRAQTAAKPSVRRSSRA